MMTDERDRTVAVLRAMDRAHEELAQGPAYYRLFALMVQVSKEMDDIVDRWNNSGLPDCVSIRDEEWKQS